MKGDDMTRDQRKADSGARAAGGGDFTGLLPFGIGIFLAIVLLMGLLRPPEGQPLGSAAVASAVQRSVGVPAALWFALALCALGGRWFLAGRSRGFVRNLAGSTGIAIGIALCAGALSQGLGGNFGDLPRRLMGEGAGRVAGALLGLGLCGASAWVAWLVQGSLLLARKIETSTATPVRLGSKAHGVTEEEAEALLPPAPLAQDEELDAPAVLPLSSPYPEDVRKRGEIPAGARPISPLGEPLDEPRRTPQAALPPGEDDSPGLYRWTPKGPAEPVQPTGRDLAQPAPERREAPPAPARAGAERAAAAAEGGAELRALAQAAEPEVPAPAAGPRPLPPRPLDPSSGVRPFGTASAPPRPSWEAAALVQEQLFEEAAEEQEEAIARSLGLQDEPPTPPPAPSVVESELAEADEADAEEEWSELDAELEELLAGPLGEEADEEELEESEELVSAELDEEGEEELDEEDQGEPEEAGSEAYATREEGEEEFEEDDLDEEESEEELVAEEAELDDALFAAEEEALEEEPALAPAAAHAPDGERQVVLEPKAPPAGAQRKLSDVVVQAGCLFLERERVAVSMLQRQFGLDFEQSCAILDELQESGLIGPYLGGQSRDILMTREEWLRKVGQA